MQNKNNGNGKVVLEGLAEASITKWGIHLNDEGLESLVRRACGLEDVENYTRMYVRVKIEWEPVETILKVNGLPLTQENSEVEAI